MKIATDCPCCGWEILNAEPAILMPFVAYRIFGWQPVTVEGLRDLNWGTSYPVCNTFICDYCNTRFLDMRFDEWEMTRLYKDYMGARYITDRKRFEPSFDPLPCIDPRAYKDKVEAFLEPELPQKISILDYGSSDLKNTPYVNTQNEIELYNLGDESPKKLSYDLITCMHVLEHDPFPRNTLHVISEYMHYRSLLYIEVPLEEKRNYWHEHVNQFNLYGLEKMLKLAGFKILKYATLDEKPSGSMFGVLQLLCKLA